MRGVGVRGWGTTVILFVVLTRGWSTGLRPDIASMIEQRGRGGYYVDGVCQ